MAKLNASILDAEGLRLTKSEIAFFRDANPFGFILFARNVDTADQVSALCDEMRAAVGRDAPILIDQEGGRVQRLRPPLARNWLPPLEFVARARRECAAGDVYPCPVDRGRTARFGYRHELRAHAGSGAA